MCSGIDGPWRRAELLNPREIKERESHYTRREGRPRGNWKRRQATGARHIFCRSLGLACLFRQMHEHLAIFLYFSLIRLQNRFDAAQPFTMTSMQQEAIRRPPGAS
jgi:hypothetical protein